jgi:hypothetical protein
LLTVRSHWAKFIAVEVGGSKPEVASQSIDLDYDIIRTFQVHEDLFRTQSPFFEAALGHDSIEAHNGIVKLLEHDRAAFEVYFRWVYSRRIVVLDKSSQGDDVDDVPYYLGWSFKDCLSGILALRAWSWFFDNMQF